MLRQSNFVLLWWLHLQIVGSREFWEGLTQRNTGGGVKTKFCCLLHRLPFEDVWWMFGEGVHPRFEKLFNMELAPFLSQGASNFWWVYMSIGIIMHWNIKQCITCVHVWLNKISYFGVCRNRKRRYFKNGLYYHGELLSKMPITHFCILDMARGFYSKLKLQNTNQRALYLPQVVWEGWFVLSDFLRVSLDKWV